MLLAGWEVRVGKNYDRGLENEFSSPRSQFFPVRTDLKPDNKIFIFFSCDKLAYKWVYAPSTNHSQKRKNNERTSEYLQDKERCIKEQVYVELLMLVAFRSPVKFSKSVFSDVSRKFEILCKV